MMIKKMVSIALSIMTLMGCFMVHPVMANAEDNVKEIDFSKKTELTYKEFNTLKTGKYWKQEDNGETYYCIPAEVLG